MLQLGMVISDPVPQQPNEGPSPFECALGFYERVLWFGLWALCLVATIIGMGLACHPTNRDLKSLGIFLFIVGAVLMPVVASLAGRACEQAEQKMENKVLDKPDYLRYYANHDAEQ